MTRSDGFRVGVLAAPYLREWQARSLERATADTDVAVSLVVVDEPAESDADPDALAAAVNGRLESGRNALDLLRLTLERERAWTLVVGERELARRFGAEHPLSERRAVTDVDCLASAEIRHVSPRIDGNWRELPSETVREIAERCDIVVRYGFGLLRGGVLEAPDHGVLSFHPADVRRYRGLGTPMAFLDGRETVGVTLQRLTEEIDGGEIVAEATVAVDDGDTLWDVYDRIHERQLDLLAEGIRNVRDPAFEPTVPEAVGPYYSMDRRRRPGFAVRTVLRNVRRRLS
ncbi:formyltransferase family protein [Natronococcus sp. A-GB1]|uniref:formyltransferase family protein n=1 Tax=Natronococcus sp. A-GB1 TaxID=3037648 RepID=UPI00241CCCAB|nr:formyltransferase family protein [Natronococcus sp. A-GB1]MDG5761819.1 formyltransferase family protein [Natronococcus sp. A-GB1]